MYKCAKTLMYLTFFVVIPTLLTACGGSATEEAGTETTSQPSNNVNKTDTSSAGVEASSSRTSSSAAPSSQAQSSAAVVLPTSTQLQLYRLSANTITLIWDDATGEIGISHYEISRDGEFIARVDYPSYMLFDQDLTPYTKYSYTITAFDLAGNASNPSRIFSVRTLAASGATSSASSLDSQSNSSLPTTISSKSNSSLSNVSSNSGSNLSSASPTSSSSLSNASSNSSSNLSSASSKSSSSRSSAASSGTSASSVASQTVTISWGHPNQRENGDFLELDEIGGYEIRYRKPTGTRYTYITFKGNQTTEYTFPEEMQIQIQGVEFEIAVFDSDGLYSQFAKVDQ